MTKYEYDRITVDYKTVKDLREALNDLGSKGWEIVNYNEIGSKRHNKVTVLVKKPINESDDKQILNG